MESKKLLDIIMVEHDLSTVLPEYSSSSLRKYLELPSNLHQAINYLAIDKLYSNVLTTRYYILTQKEDYISIAVSTNKDKHNFKILGNHKTALEALKANKTAWNNEYLLPEILTLYDVRPEKNDFLLANSENSNNQMQFAVWMQNKDKFNRNNTGWVLCHQNQIQTVIGKNNQSTVFKSIKQAENWIKSQPSDNKEYFISMRPKVKQQSKPPKVIERNPKSPSIAISLRLPEDLKRKIQAKANEKGLKYQTFIKEILKQAVNE